MAVIVITPPAVEPVSLVELKAQLGQTIDTDDVLIERKIKAARQHVERLTGQTLITTTLELVYDKFPRGPIQIPNGPLLSVTSVDYFDATTELETALTEGVDYEVDTASNPGWIAPKIAGWPSTMTTLNAVRIRFVAGYGASATAVPEPLREAVLQLASHWYENREATLVGLNAQPLPFGVDSILNEYRAWSF